MEKKIESILVPDLGGAHTATVIEILVKPGDVIKKEQPVVVLEGDKATMEVPSPLSGTVDKIQIQVGQSVQSGTPLLSLTTQDTTATPEASKTISSQKGSPQKSEKEDRSPLPETKQVPPDKKEKTPPSPSTHAAPETQTLQQPGNLAEIYAGPGVRRLAHEFGIPLARVQGSGSKGRILREDIQRFVKEQLSVAQKTGAPPPLPPVDFSKFGEIEIKPLAKIQKASGAHLSRSWMSIPHVTQFGEADITELEAFRQSQKEFAAEQNIRLTPLVFLMKAVIATLKKFPNFNASLDPSGEQLILKKYFHIGVAVDTPQGLVVPVIRDVDKKGLFELAKELGEISEKAKTKGLQMSDMQGGCFTISSLGGIGGTAFTPIINAPEVAILGVSRMRWQPCYTSPDALQIRLQLPLSLSYDHRVIDGADGARFLVELTERLADLRTLLF